MTTETQTWPDLAMALYDRLTGRGAESSYQLDDLDVLVPASTAANAPQARWKINGSITVRTRDHHPQ